jgi:hypothetical protein
MKTTEKHEIEQVTPCHCPHCNAPIKIVNNVEAFSKVRILMDAVTHRVRRQYTHVRKVLRPMSPKGSEAVSRAQKERWERFRAEKERQIQEVIESAQNETTGKPSGVD